MIYNILRIQSPNREPPTYLTRMLKKSSEDVITWEKSVSEIIKREEKIPEEERNTAEIIYSPEASLNWEKSNIPQPIMRLPKSLQFRAILDFINNGYQVIKTLNTRKPTEESSHR